MVARDKKLGIKPVKTAHVAIMDDITGKIMLADAAARGRDLGKADVGSAYLKGHRINRGKGYMRMCPTVQEYDEDGTPMVYEFSTTMWGEAPAGHEWDVVLDEECIALGFQRAEGVPALYCLVTADDVRHLQPLKKLLRLTLMNNPLDATREYRLHMIAHLPTLKMFDNVVITQSERHKVEGFNRRFAKRGSPPG